MRPKPKTIVVQSVTGKHQATLQAPTWARVTRLYATLMKRNAHLTTYNVEQTLPHLAIVTIGLKTRRNPACPVPPFPV